MSYNFDNEQEEMIEKLDEFDEYFDEIKKERGYTSRGAWGKFSGEIANRIILNYLRKHVPDDYKVVGPHVFIEDFPREFDGLIVDKECEPNKFTNAYKKEKVYVIIEVKKSGLFGKKENIGKNELENFEKIHEGTKIKPVYITFYESEKNIERIHRHWGEKYKQFVLWDRKKDKIRSGEWKDFVETICSQLKRGTAKILVSSRHEIPN